MIPKIIHNIWLDGYDNIPDMDKINYLDIKKQNPEWEFIIWDESMIQKLLKKYKSIDKLYKVSSPSNKSDIARCIIMKEYGGLYFDIGYKCVSSFDDFFLDNNENTIYIASANSSFWNFIVNFNTPKYCSCFMAMNKNHLLWDRVINKLKYADTPYKIQNALDVCLQEIEKEQLTKLRIPIVVLNKVNGNYQCVNSDMSCYKVHSYSSSGFIEPTLNYIYSNYKQFLLLFFAIFIIFFVEYLYMINIKTYGVVNFIPGIPGSAPTNVTQPQKKKNKPKQ
jgi:hypothetical protein